MNGYTLFEGTSLIDNRTPIVVIATMSSRNEKTGNMIQTWIMRSDIEPHTAVCEDKDTICGSCPLKAGEGCYVTVHQAPLNVFRAWKRGAYPTLDNVERLSGRELRIGAYGCPTNAPFEMWQQLVQVVPGWTGYTHEWRTCDPRFKNLLMASTHSVDELRQARAAGWRSFRAKLPGQELDPSEFYCPSDRGIECKDCLACDGKGMGSRSETYRSVAIDVHGSAPKLKRATLTISAK